MCTGGESDDQDLCCGVAEAGYWAAPVFVVEVGSALGACDGFAVLDQAGAEAAVGDVLLEDFEL